MKYFFESMIVFAGLAYLVVIITNWVLNRLDRWMIRLFGAGLGADCIATYFLCFYYGSGWSLSPHAIAGTTTLVIMALHFLWALKSAGSGKWERLFHRFSIIAASVWISATVSGIPMSVERQIVVSLVIVSLVLGIGYFSQAVLDRKSKRIAIFLQEAELEGYGRPLLMITKDLRDAVIEVDGLTSEILNAVASVVAGYTRDFSAKTSDGYMWFRGLEFELDGSRVAILIPLMETEDRECGRAIAIYVRGAISWERVQQLVADLTSAFRLYVSPISQ